MSKFPSREDTLKELLAERDELEQTVIKLTSAILKLEDEIAEEQIAAEKYKRSQRK